MIKGTKYIDSYGERIANLEQFDKTQITLTNSAKEEQWIKVWGANEGRTLKSIERTLKTDIYPQAITYNPFNKLIYVVNQLAATVQVFNEEDMLIETLHLDSSSIPTASPMAIAVNPLTGEAYVLGSLSDNLYVISNNIELINTIQLQSRPVSIQFNSSNQKLYIQHLIGSTISLVDINNNFAIELIETNSVQSELALDPINGAWSVVSIDGESLKIFDNSNQLVSNFNFEDRALKGITYAFQENELLAIDQESNELLSINIADGSILRNSSYDGTLTQLKRADNGNVLIAASTPDNIFEVDNNFNEINSISLKAPVADFYYDSTKELFYSVDSIGNEVNILSNTQEVSTAYFSNNYQEVLADIQHQPVLVKHLKVFYSGANDRPFFRVGFKSSAGKRESRLISLLKYQIPQHYIKIYEVTELDNHIIDGKAFWEVFVPPEQTVSLLIFHE